MRANRRFGPEGLHPKVCKRYAHKSVGFVRQSEVVQCFCKAEICKRQCSATLRKALHSRPMLSVAEQGAVCCALANSLAPFANQRPLTKPTVLYT